MAEQLNPKLLYLVLCDGFGTDPNSGKKNFLGVFDRIIVETFPSTFPSLMIAVGLEGGRGPFEIGVAIRDPNEKEVFRSPTIPVTPKEPYRREDLIVQVNGLQLTSPGGRYKIQILVNGESLWFYPLYVEAKTEAKQVATKGN